MDKKDNDFLKRLLATFNFEAEERINKIISGLFSLEQSSSHFHSMELIEGIFREVHSLKGASRSVNLYDVEKICQSLENVFSALKNNKISISSSLSKLLFDSIDFIQKILSTPAVEKSAKEDSLITELIFQLEKASKGDEINNYSNSLGNEVHDSINSGIVNPSIESVRITTAKLDSLLLQAEELITSNLSTKQMAEDLKKITGDIIYFEKQFSKLHFNTVQNNFINNSIDASHSVQNYGSDNLSGIVKECTEFIKTVANRLNVLTKKAEQDHYYLSGRVTNLLDGIKNSLMIPFSSIVEQFPNVVRKMAAENGKEIELVIQGEMLEVDRRILEEMKVPLLHLIRNCIDHGIEKPEERKSRKKSPKGTITLSISHKEGNSFEIIISDDGTGVSLDNVKSAALKLGIVTPESLAKLNEKEILLLIFQSGVSTSSIITDLSGRGLGLAIVRDTVEKLNGFVSIETNHNVGTTFRITLPLKLANFLGILVRQNHHLFIFPSSGVEHVIRVNSNLIKTIENKESIQFDGQTISLVRLNVVLKLPQEKSQVNYEQDWHSVIVNSFGKRIAFLVDEVLNEQAVLIKSFGKPLVRVKNILGAAILGNGALVPVINIQDLVKSSIIMDANLLVSNNASLIPNEVIIKKFILLAEDSITARTMLKNILESAGFIVNTAVDGIDAFTKLRENKYDIVVSDVEMPRMNGFDLTSKIRSDEKLSDLPVVLVTALDSRENKEKGIDVGANAYIVKSSFDQSNLLEVINRLI